MFWDGGRRRQRKPNWENEKVMHGRIPTMVDRSIVRIRTIVRNPINRIPIDCTPINWIPKQSPISRVPNIVRSSVAPSSVIFRRTIVRNRTMFDYLSLRAGFQLFAEQLLESEQTMSINRNGDDDIVGCLRDLCTTHRFNTYWALLPTGTYFLLLPMGDRAQ